LNIQQKEAELEYCEPFHYLDLASVENVLDRINQFADEIDVRFKPASILSDIAKSGKYFYK